MLIRTWQGSCNVLILISLLFEFIFLSHCIPAGDNGGPHQTSTKYFPICEPDFEANIFCKKACFLLYEGMHVTLFFIILYNWLFYDIIIDNSTSHFIKKYSSLYVEVQEILSKFSSICNNWIANWRKVQNFLIKHKLPKAQSFRALGSWASFSLNNLLYQQLISL